MPRIHFLDVTNRDGVQTARVNLSKFGKTMVNFYLGKLGTVPGWPGDDACPPQPMIGQTCAVLDQYAAGGGSYTEVVYPGCGREMLET